MMSREEKQEILDFVNLYVILGIVRLSILSKHLGISERTIQRWNKNGVDDHRKGSAKNVVRKLSESERDELYLVACSDEYKDMNPHEVYNSLLDKGIYFASESSFYRVLREKKALCHRRETKEGTSRKKPDELKATAKNQVWMWDITWLKTDVKGIYYYAYVIEDLYDRSIVGWMIFENESDVHAKELFEAACLKEKAHPKFVHSDNGEPMKGITLVAFYYQLGIIPSFSRRSAATHTKMITITGDGAETTKLSLDGFVRISGPTTVEHVTLYNNFANESLTTEGQKLI